MLQIYLINLALAQNRRGSFSAARPWGLTALTIPYPAAVRKGKDMWQPLAALWNVFMAAPVPLRAVLRAKTPLPRLFRPAAGCGSGCWKYTDAPGGFLAPPAARFGRKTVFGKGSQHSRLPKATHLPLLRSKSRMLSPEMSTWTWAPMVKRVLPNTTPVSRKSPMRTLMVDSIPVGIAP